MPPTYLFYHILSASYIEDYAEYSDNTGNVSNGLNIKKINGLSSNKRS